MTAMPNAAERPTGRIEKISQHGGCEHEHQAVVELG